MIEIIKDGRVHTCTNQMQVEFSAISDNEAFARMAVAAFVMSLNPTIEELTDIKTAVSEAVTNAIIHGYENRNDCDDKVVMQCMIHKDVLEVIIRDNGIGMEDVDKAMEPLYTTKPELERSGMGFAFMEAFMDDLYVHSALGSGTVVKMQKKIGMHPWIERED